MRKSTLLTALMIAAILISACAPAAAPATPQIIKETVEVPKQVQVEVTKVVQQQVVVTPTPGPNPEAMIQGVEPNAEIHFWTYYLSPTFDQYIKDTIARFNQAYPDVKVDWEDHQATFPDDMRNAFAAGNAPDVINLSISEGWVSDYASQGKLLALDGVVPADVKSLYFPSLWDQQVVGGKHYQFPWYQGIHVNLVNTKILTDAGFTAADFPAKWDDIPAFCQTIKTKTGTLCDIRLTVNDLLAQMVYEGGVKIVSDDGTKFTFDSPEAVAWLQHYVGMVKAGTVDKTVLVTDQDRVGLDLFTSGKAAFYDTGPNLIRDVRANNPGLYGYLAVVPSPVGKSGVVGKGLMAISVKADTKFPNASIALAQFFTNPKSMLEFAKIVSIYPSTPASYDDPFFSAKPVAIEDSAKPYAKDAISKLADIVPSLPKGVKQADVNNIVLQAIQQALFNGADPQKVLTDAVAAANKLIQ
jgi:putative chitobiose transport system substrate-binding protein